MRSIKEYLNEVNQKFNTGDKVKLISGDYAGNEGKITKVSSDAGKYWYIVTVHDRKDRKAFQGFGSGKEIKCQEKTIKKI